LSKQRSKPAPQSWPADKVESWPIDRLKPYERNARTHSDAQVSQIAESIREFGWTVPVLATKEGRIIAGHGRVEAARALGLDRVPVMVAEGWTGAQVRAYTLADNRLALNAGWDDEILAVELDDLRDLGVDLESLGFSGQELNDLIGTPNTGLSDSALADEVPPVPDDPTSRSGDLWFMGGHRLLCGDSTSPDAVARLMNGSKAGLCFTSPPYAQQRDYTKSITDWDGLMRGVFGCLPMTELGQVLVNLGLVHRDREWWPYWESWVEWMRANGWKRFGWYVWDQGFGLPGDWNGRLAPSHEFVFHFNRESVAPAKWIDKQPENIKPRNKGESTMRGKDGKTKPFTNPEASGQPTKIPDSIIRVGRQVGSDGHPAQFPVGLPAFVMQSWPDGICYEPFIGSGSSMIAAESTGRACYGMELAPEYVDVAVLRWQQFTGKSATLDGDGRTFEEVKSERQKAGPHPTSSSEGEPGKASAPATRGKGRARRADAATVPV